MKRKILLVVITVLVICTACGLETDLDAGTREGQRMSEDYGAEEDERPAVYEYEADIIRYSERAGKFSFRKDVKKTETDYAVYYFEISISEQERQACMEATDSALSQISGMLPELEIAVFTRETFGGTAVSGNRLYTSIQPWDSAEYLAGVLLAAYGEWGNYGLAYGYADYLCREAGLEGREAYHWETDNQKTDNQEMNGFQPMSSPELYDLNLLCFSERFVSPEDVEAAKNNACCFAADYLLSHSEEEFLKLLSDSGTVEGVVRANEALEAYYEQNGVDCSLTEIRYRYGGVTMDYAAACKYAIFYIDKDWQDKTWETNPKVTEHLLHENYEEVRQFFEVNAKQMGQYQELFGLENYGNDLAVFFPYDTSLTDASFYMREKHTIYLNTVVSLMHEYIHALMDGHDDRENQWTYEGFARNYDCFYNDYAYDYWNHDYNHAAEIYGSIEAVNYYNAYIEHIGRPIDVRTDYRDLGDFLTRAYGWDDPNETYQSGASFVAYLVDCYGEQAVIRYIGSDKKYNEEWGKTYEELVQDWLNYINENYSWYHV